MTHVAQKAFNLDPSASQTGRTTQVSDNPKLLQPCTEESVFRMPKEKRQQAGKTYTGEIYCSLQVKETPRLLSF